MAEIRHEIIYYTVLMMLALLVPIPFVDDVLKNYLRRRMIERLARNYQCELSELEVKVLARENGEGCLSGCLMRMLFYPIKKLFRKMFFLWGWKKALDEASYTLHYAVLLDYSMQEGWLGPQGRYEVSQVRCYIEAVLEK